MRPRSKQAGLLGLLLVLVLFSRPAEALFGTVVDVAGSPIPGVLVENSSSKDQTLTGPDGAFSLPASPLPVTLRFYLDGYGEGSLQVRSESEVPITIRLSPQAFEGEEIAVSARAPNRPLAPASLSSTTIRADSAPGALSSLTELAVSSPAVSESGQGGLFQVLAVRGVSRQRLRTSIGGVPIISDRRAGASASFVDAELLGGLEILRGPVSSAYGSGALGGVIQANLRAFEGPFLATGVESQGSTRFAAAGWGSEATGWSNGLAVRRASRGEDGDGQTLANGFTQTSAFMSREWEKVSLLVLGSYAADIEKPNIDFPQRETVYPNENHVLLRLGLDTPIGWRVQLFAHSNGLDTRTVESTGEVAEVSSEALDLGLTAHRKLGIFRIGIDYFGRQGVNVRERQLAPGREDSFLQSLRRATEDELGLLASTSWSWGRTRLEGGGRWTWHRQTNGAASGESSEEGREAVQDNEPSLFLGLVVPVTNSFELLANLGTGLRFPTLSERFFTGTTGRGQSIANADLEPETAETIDVGARWFGPRSAVSLFAYRTRIEGFVERVELKPDVTTFANIVCGTIEGIEAEALLRVSQRLRFSIGGHWTQGRDASNGPLEDVPPHRIQASAHLRRGSWEVLASPQYRFAKKDFGGGEKEIGDAFLLNLTIVHKLSRELSVSLTGDNLFDTAYHPSADRKASLAPGRSVGLGLSWQP